MADLEPGYRAYNGYVFTAADCALYNAHTRRVERAQGHERQEQERNSRHMAFCIITGCNG
jgi:hypothetical protein